MSSFNEKTCHIFNDKTMIDKCRAFAQATAYPTDSRAHRNVASATRSLDQKEDNIFMGKLAECMIVSRLASVGLKSFPDFEIYPDHHDNGIDLKLNFPNGEIIIDVKQSKHFAKNITQSIDKYYLENEGKIDYYAFVRIKKANDHYLYEAFLIDKKEFIEKREYVEMGSRPYSLDANNYCLNVEVKESYKI